MTGPSEAAEVAGWLDAEGLAALLVAADPCPPGADEVAHAYYWLGEAHAALPAARLAWPLAFAAGVAEGRRQAAEAIAMKIEAELVCCEAYELDRGTERAGTVHAICFWGGAAAALARDHAEVSHA